MKTDKFQHTTDTGLKVLLFGDEDSDEYRTTAAHVELCDTCRRRLDEIAGPNEVEGEARALLNDYPWDEASPIPADEDGKSSDSIDLGFLGPPSHPEMLGRLGRYEIERVIGSGGMGNVLKAFDTELNRPVAIKVLVEHLAHRGAARKRFAREAKAAAAIVHEHVVAIHNVETTHDLPFLVMQYVAGESLQARVDRNGPLDAKEILRIGIQTAAGLAAAHEQGVIHRDIKPANILLEEGVERALITDFGLARTIDDASLTHTGIVAGTPHYMSPEQANGETTDHRTDLFSLGSVLYFMATGHGPFRAERAMGVLHRICYDTHRPVCEVNPDIPEELSEMIDRLLEKKPSLRFASALECKDAFTRLLFALQQGRSRRRRRGRFERWLRRSKMIPGLTGLAVVAAAIVFMLLLAPKPLAEQHTQRPAKQQDVEAIAETDAVPSKLDMDSLAAESAADATSLGEIASDLAELDATFNGSTFFRKSNDSVPSEVQSIQQTLDRLNASTLGGNGRGNPWGERGNWGSGGGNPWGGGGGNPWGGGGGGDGGHPTIRTEVQSIDQATNAMNGSTRSGSSSALREDFQSLDQALDRLSDSTFSGNWSKSFQREVDLIDQLLDRLNGKEFSDSKNVYSNGANR